MNALLVALSLFATSPDSATETIRLQNLPPSMFIRKVRTLELFQSEIVVYGSDVDRTVSIVGSENERTDFKQIIRMLDVPSHNVQLAFTMVLAEIKDGKLVTKPIASPSIATVNNEDAELLFGISNTLYRLTVKSRVNNDGTTTSFLEFSRDKEGEAARFARTTRRLKPGEKSGFVGFTVDAADAKVLIGDGKIPESGFTRAIFIDLSATAK